MSSSITLSLWETVAGIAGTASVGAGVTLWFVRSSLRDWLTARRQVLNWIDSGLSIQDEPDPDRPKLRLRKPGNPRERFQQTQDDINRLIQKVDALTGRAPEPQLIPLDNGVEPTPALHPMQRCKVEPITDYPSRKKDDDDTPPTPPAVVAHKPDWRTDPTGERPAVNVEMTAALLATALGRQVKVRLLRPVPSSEPAVATTSRRQTGYTPRHSVAA